MGELAGDEGPSIRAVIDTSSLFPPRLRTELQQAAQLGAFTAIWSPWIIAELNRVLTWSWVRRHGASTGSQRRCGSAAGQMMEYLLASFEIVDPKRPYPPPWTQLADESDHSVWAAAKLARAHYVISENSHHYPPKQGNGRHSYEGIEYLPGKAFLSLLT